MTRPTLLLLTPLLGLLTACGSAGEPCAAARDHLQACFGGSAASALASSCDPDRAELLLQQDCTALAGLMLDGKADAVVEDAVRRAIQKAIREAIVVGVQQALEAAFRSFGSSLKNYDLFLLLDSASSKAAANARAAELRQLIGDEPGFQPTVLRTGGTYRILHGPCPLDLEQDLGRLIADLAMKRSRLLEALGGEVEISADSDGASIQLRLPLQLLPLPRSVSSTLGCGQ